MHSPAMGRSMALSPARRSSRPLRSTSALLASALCGSLLALVRVEATSAGGALPGSPRVDFQSSNNEQRDSDTLLVGEVTPAGKAGLYVPLTKRPRSDGAVYGVDVGEGGISRRRLEGTGVGIEEGGERIDMIYSSTLELRIVSFSLFAYVLFLHFCCLLRVLSVRSSSTKQYCRCSRVQQ